MARKIWGFGARHVLGISFLAVTVLMWTASSFLASTIFADNTYSKPYFVTYFNTNTFTIFLVVRVLTNVWHEHGGKSASKATTPSASRLEDTSEEREGLIGQDSSPTAPAEDDGPLPPLTVQETISVALQFCILWFAANWTQSKSLEYTSVASATILFSTSGVWTLAFGAWLKVEPFTLRKLLGVLASLAGVVIIAFGDVTGSSDEHRGTFPHKSSAEIAAGDILALGSASLYGLYTTLLKKRIHDESRVDVMLFLGIVGLANTLMVWPGLVVLHFTGWETFELPPTQRVWEIVLGNALISLISDLTWAYAVLYTSPLIVTIGLSLSIPLSIVGQFFLHGQSATVSYFFGAVIVFAAFIFINHESQPEVAVVSEERRQEE